MLRKREYKRLTDVLEQLRHLYNAALEQRRLAYQRQHKSLSFFDQCKDLTELRNADERFGILSATMVRLTVLKRLHLAFQAFFRRLKIGTAKAGFPRFRGKGRFGTLIFGADGWSLKGNRLRLNGIGTFSVVGSRRHVAGQIKGLWLKRVADRWEAQIIVDVGAAPVVKQAKNGVGIDVGIKTFAALSDGSRIEHPHFLKKSLEQVKAAQKALSTKRRESRRRADAKLKLARLHRRVANRRSNFLHQATAKLVKDYDGFAIEKLDIQEMTRQSPEGLTPKQVRGLHRNIMDSAWNTFGHFLSYKAEYAGSPFMEVDPKGTSQRCSQCGTIVRKTLQDRVHHCPACGLTIDRDENSAVNIKHLGWRCADNCSGSTMDHSNSCGGSR